ncbi:MAG: cation diffusion facilitator family transporter [Planctomycetota bacterium]
MDPLSNILLRRFVPEPARPSDPAVRLRCGRLEGYASILVNAALFAVKIALGLSTRSIALIADAFHTLGDIATSVIVILGFEIGAKPGDEEHPFGHGRMEAVSALVLSLLLAVTAFEFAKESVQRILHPQEMRIGYAAVAILAGTIVVKEWLSRFALVLARKINSKALEGDFWHHRSDSIATALVVAGFLLAPLGLPYVDGVAGLLVCLIIGWAAFSIAHRAIDPLIGEAPPPETVASIEEIALSVPLVVATHEVTVQRYGDLHFISLHVEVPAHEPISRLHGVSEEVERRISERFPGTAIVHIDPVDRNHPEYARVENLVRAAVGAHPDVLSFHDLRLVGGPDLFKVVLNVTVECADDPARVSRLRRALADAVRTLYPRSRVVVKVEPRFPRQEPPPPSSGA